MPAGRPATAFSVDGLYRTLNLNGFGEKWEWTYAMGKYGGPPQYGGRCPVTARPCGRAGCTPKACRIGRHLGRLSVTAVRDLLRDHSASEVARDQPSLLRTVRDVLNDESMGPMLEQALVEASLSARGGET